MVLGLYLTDRSVAFADIIRHWLQLKRSVVILLCGPVVYSTAHVRAVRFHEDSVTRVWSPSRVLPDYAVF